MKNLKKIIGISLFCQSATFGALFFILASKKKSHSKAFAAISILSAVAGGVLFYLGLTESKKKKRMLALEDCYDADDDFEDNFEDDLTCSFEDDDAWDDLDDDDFSGNEEDDKEDDENAEE